MHEGEKCEQHIFRQSKLWVLGMDQFYFELFIISRISLGLLLTH